MIKQKSSEVIGLSGLKYDSLFFGSVDIHVSRCLRVKKEERP